MRADGWQEKPLKGAVVCCTSISPELRSQYAEHVCQMGAEHKLDLTSDVTHLIVGDTDTPKYKYVAKERVDVKVLQPEWIDAVRKRWMADDTIDMNALELQYRVPTLAGLKICITGFDDLSFRAQLHKNIVENGGQYTGDLTKDVTHLIACRPVGKKYEYGTQWQKKIVSLRWYKDTLERGMQLEESAYHPSIPDDEQGIGAWNRMTRTATSLGIKRPRNDSQDVEQPRKLRRTASARLSSQNDTMWSDIVSKDTAPPDESRTRRLLVSRSVPDLKRESQQRDNAATIAGGIFDGKYFVIQAFSVKHEPILKNVLVSHGGMVLETLAELCAVEHIPREARILLLPHQAPLEQVPPRHESMHDFEVTSELWVEHCMFSKTYQPPDTYRLGRLLPRIKPQGFSKLVVSSTGFSGIVPNHIDKVIRHLGATYEQTFKREASVLVCDSLLHNQQKVDLARLWQIPVVTESWLWACIRENRKVSFDKHSLPRTRVSELQQPKRDVEEPAKQSRVNTGPADNPGCTSRSRKEEASRSLTAGKAGNERLTEHAPEQENCAFCIDPNQEPDDDISGPPDCIVGVRQEARPVSKPVDKQPLCTVASNLSPRRPRKESQTPKKRLFQRFDGGGSDVENAPDGSKCVGLDLANDDLPVSRHVSDAQTLNGEIRDLLDLKSKLKEQRSEFGASSRQPKKQLLGRALSNLSNTSSISHVRQSRAGSVDSVNTDGVGSEVGPAASLERKPVAKDEPLTNASFVGRATSRLFESRTNSMTMMAASAADGEETEWAADEAPEPALTQLVYEDPEEAIQLREKLAAKRRQRSKAGQKDSDPKPAKQRSVGATRIKDDDVLVGTGWGTGRRTRQKTTTQSPVGLKEF